MKNNIKYMDADDALIGFIMSFYFLNALNILIRLDFGDLPYWTYISKSIGLLFLIVAIPYLIKRGNCYVFFFTTIMLILFIVTELLGNAGGNFIKNVIYCMGLYFPLGLCIYCIRDPYRLIKTLQRSTFFLHILLLILMLTFETESGDPYSMSGGYALLTQLLVISDSLIEDTCGKKKIVILGITIIDVIVILLRGSRGPILCIVGYILIKILFKNNKLNVSKVFFIGLLLVCIGGMILFYVPVATLIVKTFGMLGIHSRTVESLLYKSLSNIMREQLYAYYLNKIKLHPLLGYGLAGGWDLGYPHNILLEFLLSFGIPIGGALFVCLLIIIYKGITQKDIYWRRLAHIFVAENISLIVSGSFLLTPSFFMCLACCLKNGIIKNETGDIKIGEYHESN